MACRYRLSNTDGFSWIGRHYAPMIKSRTCPKLRTCMPKIFRIDLVTGVFQVLVLMIEWPESGLLFDRCCPMRGLPALADHAPLQQDILWPQPLANESARIHTATSPPC